MIKIDKIQEYIVSLRIDLSSQNTQSVGFPYSSLIKALLLDNHYNALNISIGENLWIYLN